MSFLEYRVKFAPTGLRKVLYLNWPLVVLVNVTVVELYAEAELAVVPSLYEGFSLPAIEAMCTGICLVATDGGALPEVTGIDGDTVLSCVAGDAEALAATIRRGLDDPALRAAVGARGRQRVVERWTWRRCAEQTVDQYREVLAMPENQAKLQRNGRIA